MAFTVGWSVVFGEQPTAAKWNQLGENDDALRDGSGVLWNNNQEIQAKNAGGTTKKFLRLDNDNFMKVSQVPYRSDDSNTPANNTREDVVIVHGYEQFAGSGTAGMSGTVSFGITFDSAPVVVAQHIGVTNSGTAANIAGLNNAIGDTTVVGLRTSSITTTGFDFQLTRTSGTFSGSQYWGVGFIAIGVKA